MKINPYKIVRDHDNETRFFRVEVEEIEQWGIGFQISINGTLYGFSITNK